MFSDQTALMVTIEKEINSKFKSSIHKALVNCIFTGNMIQHIHENGLRAYDLSFQQFNILRILKGAKKKVTMNYLKVGLLDKSPNATRLTDKLAEKGLIYKIKAERDKRVQYVSITPEGEAMMKKLITAFDNKFITHLEFDEADAEKLSELLDKLREANSAFIETPRHY
ncbi:MAG: winged helix DNA-binding protein [Saprospiraceae bacterium]|nr:winged helix DNA-binding protein [Saprospiraceae bacterium]